MQIRLATKSDEALYNATITHHSVKNKVNLYGSKDVNAFDEAVKKTMLCKSITCSCEGCLYRYDIFVVEYKLHTIGFFIVNYDGSEAEIEFCVTPEFVGKGYGKNVVKLGILYTQRLHPEITYFRADCVNNASEELCMKLGFGLEICGDYFYNIN